MRKIDAHERKARKDRDFDSFARASCQTRPKVLAHVQVILGSDKTIMHGGNIDKLTKLLLQEIEI